MKDNPLVSVVIPTYNSEKTLAKCLESIKNQTYKNTESVIVDNFSTDKTTEIKSILELKNQKENTFTEWIPILF